MSALIGALRVSLSADTAQFEAGMKRAQATSNTAASGIARSMNTLKAGVSGLVAGLSVGLFVRGIQNALEYAGSLAEVAQQLGVTAKDLQTFRFAAEQVGVGQEQLETGLSKLTITLGKMAAGATAPAKALNAIGVSVDQIKGKDTGEAFRIIADGLQKVTDRSQRAAVEVTLFGKTGSMLDNLLSGGSEALNKLAQAAEELGIVLSDEQIRNADDTADKLRAVQTVLSANIAAVVADNAGAILTLANALAALIGWMGQAAAGWKRLVAEFSVPLHMNQNPLHTMGMAGRAVDFRERLFAMTTPKAAKPVAGPDIAPFLGGGGKPKAAQADHSAEDKLREQFQFDQDLRRAQMDTLRAQQDLAKDYIERTTIGVEILNAEKSAYEAELAYEIALNALTKGKQGMTAPQAAQLQAEYNIKDSLERQKLLQDEQEQRQRDVQELTQHDYDRRRDVLHGQAAIATTVAERRKIELELLRIAYEQKRQALQNIVDTSKNIKEQEDARRDLLNLKQTYGNDRKAVMQSTRGPLEEWAAHIPQTAAEINEALQSIEVNGLDGLSDAIANVITGTESLKDAFGSLAKSIIADIIRMSIRMLIFRAISGVFGKAFGGDTGTVDPWSETMGGIYSGLPGFASGGSMRLGGVGGIDTNILSANGVAFARYTAGERIDIANDNVNAGTSRLIVELRDPLLDARIVQGSRVEIARTYGAVQAGVGRNEFEKRRRSS